LYLQVNEPELAAEPDAAAEAIIEQGREVGLLAREMFPGGVELRNEGLDQAIRHPPTTSKPAASQKPTSRYKSGFDECIGDFAPTDACQVTFHSSLRLAADHVRR
jgi:hypothetical protein